LSETIEEQSHEEVSDCLLLSFLIAVKLFVLRLLDLRRLLPYPMVGCHTFERVIRIQFCCCLTHFPKPKQILGSLVLSFQPMTEL